jgi:RNA polymerase sigma-70 factor (ECF subfamily)
LIFHIPAVNLARIPELVSGEVVMAELPTESGASRDLLQRASGGDPRAVEELLACYRTYLHQFITLRLDPKVRSRVDPSDVVQEAQLEAVRRLPDYLRQPDIPFRLWLRQLAFDRVLKVRRHHVQAARRAIGREVHLPEESSYLLAQQLVASGPTPSQQLGKREQLRRVREAIEQLPEADREVLLLRHFEGLSNQEAAYLLGIEPAAASQRHGRAMLRLHKLLFDQGLTEDQP